MPTPALDVATQRSGSASAGRSCHGVVRSATSCLRVTRAPLRRSTSGAFRIRRKHAFSACFAISLRMFSLSRRDRTRSLRALRREAPSRRPVFEMLEPGGDIEQDRQAFDLLRGLLEKVVRATETAPACAPRSKARLRMELPDQAPREGALYLLPSSRCRVRKDARRCGPLRAPSSAARRGKCPLPSKA